MKSERFITVFTIIHHLSLSWASLLQSAPPHPHQSHSPKIQLHIIIAFTFGSSKWSFTLRFPHQHPSCTSPLPHSCYMRSPSHSRFYHTKNIYGEEFKSLSSPSCSFLHSLVTWSLLGPHILLSTLFSNNVDLCSSLNVSYPLVMA